MRPRNARGDSRLLVTKEKNSIYANPIGACLVALVCAGLYATCKKNEPSPNGSDPVIAEALTKNAAMVLVLRPSEWLASKRLLNTIWARFLPLKNLSPILEAPDLWAAVVAASAEVDKAAGHSPAALPSNLSGWDQSRPVVATLAEAEPTDLSLFLRVLTRNAALESWPGLRHELILPAVDSVALSEAVQKVVLALHPRAVLDSHDEPRLGGGMMFSAGDSSATQLLGVVIPDKTSVRVQIFTHFYAPFFYSEEKASLYPLWQRLDSHEHTRRSPADTPARHAFLQSRDMVSVYVGGDKLRDRALQMAAVIDLNSVPPGHEIRHARLEYLPRWFATELVRHFHISPSTAEADDWTFRYSPRYGTRLAFTGTLTKTGESKASEKSPALSGLDDEVAVRDLVGQFFTCIPDYCLRGLLCSATTYANPLHWLLQAPFATSAIVNIGQWLDSSWSVHSGSIVGRIDLRARGPWNPSRHPCRERQALQEGHQEEEAIKHPHSSKDRPCMERLTAALAKLLEGIANSHKAAPPRNFDTCALCKQGLAETEAALRCALEDTSTREHAKRVKAALDMLMAEWHGELFERDRQGEILQTACDRKEQEACSLLAAVKVVPEVELAEGTTACGESIGYQGRVPMTLTREGHLYTIPELNTKSELKDRYIAIEIDKNATLGSVIDITRKIPFANCDLIIGGCSIRCNDAGCVGRYAAVLLTPQHKHVGVPISVSPWVDGQRYVPLRIRLVGDRMRLEYQPHTRHPAEWCQQVQGRCSLVPALERAATYYPQASGLVLFFKGPRSTPWGKIVDSIAQSDCLAYHWLPEYHLVLDDLPPKIWRKDFCKGKEEFCK
jgi:hypothetical protein